MQSNDLLEKVTGDGDRGRGPLAEPAAPSGAFPSAGATAAARTSLTGLSG